MWSTWMGKQSGGWGPDKDKKLTKMEDFDIMVGNS